MTAVAANATLEARVADIYQHWDALGVHRTGTATDAATATWLAEAGRALGFDAALESFPFRRRNPIAAAVTLADGTRLEGVPMFDAGATSAAGLDALLGDAPGEIALRRTPPYDSLPAARELEALRHGGQSAGILAVTDESFVLPGLALLNAESFHAPYGPPVLQLPSTAWRSLQAAVGQRIKLDVRFETDATAATNVRIEVPGSEPDLAPVVVITPRSGWWHSTSERGGGIAVWLDLLHLLAALPPRRRVIFSANTGHELGHVGMQRFLDANEALLAHAHGWIHLGANFGTAMSPQIRLQASDQDTMDMADAALGRHRVAPATRTEIGTAPLGEARDIHAGGGRYVSILGSNGAFHHPADRWPDMVDVSRTADIARAFREILIQLAHR